MSIHIRELQDKDAPLLWRVFHRAIHQTASADYSPEQVSAWSPKDVDMVQWQARMEGINPFVAEVDGEVAGFADLQVDGYIDMFFVSPQFGRRGVGHALMAHILQQARESRTPELYSNVSITARPFFESFGFHVVAPRRVQTRGVEFTNYRMLLPL